MSIHVVLVPYPGFGHLIPFHQFAITLAQKGVRISFISTPKNIQKLAKIPTELAPLITMVEFHLHHEAEASVDVPYEKMASLMRAYDLLKQQFKDFVMQQLPDWIIVDALPIWAVEVAQECGVKVIMFSVFSAAYLTFLGLFEGLKEEREKRLRLLPESIMKSPEWVDFPSTVAYRRHEAASFHFLCKIDGRKSISERLVRVLADPCQAIAIRSCDEVESDYLRVLGNVARRPVFPVGLLLPEKNKSEMMEEIKKGKWGNMFKWLEDQEPRSVVFVGFGSECKLVKEQVHEIAYGLEISKLPFLWMLQNPDWDVKDEDHGPLPAGFRSRTSSQAFVKFGWAPQKEILAHPSITCSLFHSGWGSAIENLQHGNSLVVLPMVYDQFLTARLLVEKSLAIEVDRKEDGTFSRDDIAKSLKLAMFSKQGEELRNRAANVFADPMLHLRHDHCVSKFVEYLKK